MSVSICDSQTTKMLQRKYFLANSISKTELEQKPKDATI